SGSCGDDSRAPTIGAESPNRKLPGSASRGYEFRRTIGDEHVGEFCQCSLRASSLPHNVFGGCIQGCDARAEVWTRRAQERLVVACVLVTDQDGSVERDTRTFGTMTADLQKLAEWLDGFGVTHRGHGVEIYP